MHQNRPTRRWIRRETAILVAVGAAIAPTVTACTSDRADSATVTPPVATSTAPVATTIAPATERPTPSDPTATDDEGVDSLPEADHAAVIPGLLAAPPFHPSSVTHAAFLRRDTLLRDDAGTAVAVLPARDFRGEPTVVLPVRVEGDRTLVLTPARVSLPSQNGGSAPAQSAAWVRSEALRRGEPLPARIVVDVGAERLRIVGNGTERSWPVGVGAPGTPSPTDVTGYLQQRYTDPAQSDRPIQLTSLHATQADEPYGGSDGGLIGLHAASLTTGRVSHGCVRLPPDALEAVDALPRGTVVIFTS